MGYINIILIFSATALTCYLVASIGYKAATEHLEKKRNKKYDIIKRFISPTRLLQRRIAVSLFLGVGLLTCLVSFDVLNPAIYIPSSCAFGILGYMAPLWYYILKERKRKDAFERKILDLTMGLANGMRSGLALPQALEAVTKRIAEPMKDELTTVLREYRLGLELPEALSRLNERIPCEDLHLLVTTIRLTTKSGGSLVDVLEKMVETIRGRTEFQERLKNMTAQGRFEAIAMSLAPVAAFIILYVVDPVLMGPMLTTGIGWCAIGVIAILVAIGFFVINKIVTVEV